MKTNELKWWQIRRVKLTRQYLAGTIAGLGLGCVVAWSLPNEAVFQVFGRIVGFGLIAIGASMAYNDQQNALA